MKQILKYPGSKYKSADWIIRQFPEHHSYLEPFFGSGAILFNKERSDMVGITQQAIATSRAEAYKNAIQKGEKH